MEPETRLLKIDESITGDDSLIYIPYVQSIGLISEDMLVEQQHAMEEENSSQHHSHLKADIEAFKAANPGCVMADFVRWYSPADWLSENSTDIAREDASSQNEEEISEIGSDGIQDVFPGFGRLSARMRAPSNTWREIW
eukprot:CAMPEP_0206168320 /NCGR_PEP_ID=MMETSP1474-20131121/31591_1 /ASSEMBLY_ACC=CAM_ASM_001110 /TAXON_ID=97495 /ORGANISM="Imantonia sp., Strain RCC918" /LENGTH=138 /DNA_ID=CAMNT_0053573605 /DNA_START=192 /DNA_END=605 /DNA_ORIENTATION=-